MVIRIPKTYRNPYSQTSIQDKTRITYDRKQKKQKILHEQIITKTNFKTKRKYQYHEKFKDDGNIRKVKKKNRLELTTKDRNDHVRRKYRLQDGSVKRVFTNIDVIETTTIYERKPDLKWQVFIIAYYKKIHGKTVFKKYLSSKMKYEPITYSKVKNEINDLVNKAEYMAYKSDFHIIKIVPMIRYYDRRGGINKT